MMDQDTAVTTWCAVCGNDTVWALPITRRLVEEFARRIEAAERERCAKLCDPTNADRPEDWTEYAKVRAQCAARIRGPNV